MNKRSQSTNLLDLVAAIYWKFFTLFGSRNAKSPKENALMRKWRPTAESVVRFMVQLNQNLVSK